MPLSDYIRHGVLGYVYTALALISLQSLWQAFPLTVMPVLAWSLLLALPVALGIAVLSWLLGKRDARPLSTLDWVLLLNALLLLGVLALEIPTTLSHG